jgi:hypothetical protein
MSLRDMTEFTGGLGIGQSWRERDRSEICRVVTIDPALHMIEVEDGAGHVERDTIEHFLLTHYATAC